MKGYRLFLAYYTFIISLALFIWSTFYGPKPQSYLITALVSPVSIYFLLLITGISKTPPLSENKGTKAPLIILLIFLISSISIFAYASISSRLAYSKLTSISSSNQISTLKLDLESQSKKTYEDLTRKLEEIKSQLINIKGTQNVSTDMGTFNDVATLAGTVTIIDKKYPTINVYAEKSASSAAVGKAEFGKNYTFIQKDQNWYLILLETKEGFINSQFVKEIQY